MGAGRWGSAASSADVKEALVSIANLIARAHCDGGGAVAGDRDHFGLVGLYKRALGGLPDAQALLIVKGALARLSHEATEKRHVSGGRGTDAIHIGKLISRYESAHLAPAIQKYQTAHAAADAGAAAALQAILDAGGSAGGTFATPKSKRREEADASPQLVDPADPRLVKPKGKREGQAERKLRQKLAAQLEAQTNSDANGAAAAKLLAEQAEARKGKAKAAADAKAAAEAKAAGDAKTADGGKGPKPKSGRRAWTGDFSTGSLTSRSDPEGDKGAAQAWDHLCAQTIGPNPHDGWPCAWARLFVDGCHKPAGAGTCKACEAQLVKVTPDPPGALAKIRGAANAWLLAKLRQP